MSKYVLFLLTIIPSFLIGQTATWLNLSHECQGTPFLISHVSANDHIVATIPTINKNYVSMDFGETWSDQLTGFGRWSNEIQTDGFSELYYTNNNQIYKYDQAVDKTELVHDNSAYGYIEDGVIMDNGEIILVDKVGRTATIRYFDNDGSLIMENELDGDVSYINLHYQKGYDTYLSLGYFGSTPEKNVHLLDLDDLSLGAPTDIPNHTSGIHYLNGRLFSSNLFSDNGGTTWETVSSSQTVNYSTSIDVKDNLVVMLTPSQLMVSQDYGETFVTTQQNPGFSNGQQVVISEDGSRIFVYFDYYDVSYSAIYSDDFGSTWTTFNKTFDIPHLTGIATAMDDNMVVNSIDCGRQYFLDDNWDEINTNGNQNYLYTFEATPVGNFVGLDAANIYLSVDGGANWDVIVGNYWESQNIIPKEDMVYVLRYGEIAASTTSGNSYTLYTSDSIGFWGHNYDCFSDLKILNYNSNDELNIYNLTDDTSLPLGKTKDPELHLDMATDWSGTAYHILEYKDNLKTKFVLQNYEGLGTGFNEIEIPITPVGTNHRMETDQNDNIIIHNKFQIILTQDNGQTWHDLSPDMPEESEITDIAISYDHYLYLSSFGTDILKYPCPLNIDITTCPDFTSETDDLAASKVNVYPNPSSDLLFIDVEQTINYQLKLYTTQGQLLISSFNDKTIETKSLAMGTYFLEIKDVDSGQKRTERIVILR